MSVVNRWQIQAVLLIDDIDCVLKDVVPLRVEPFKILVSSCWNRWENLFGSKICFYWEKWHINEQFTFQFKNSLWSQNALKYVVVDSCEERSGLKWHIPMLGCVSFTVLISFMQFMKQAVCDKDSSHWYYLFLFHWIHENKGGKDKPRLVPKKWS